MRLRQEMIFPEPLIFEGDGAFTIHAQWRIAVDARVPRT
jgi:hypothetical protein